MAHRLVFTNRDVNDVVRQMLVVERNKELGGTDECNAFDPTSTQYLVPEAIGRIVGDMIPDHYKLVHVGIYGIYGFLIIAEEDPKS